MYNKELKKIIEFCKREGISEEFYQRYIRVTNSMHRCKEVPCYNNKVMFLPSYMFVLQNSPYLIEIEDIMTLFAPWIVNGEQKNIKIQDTEAYKFAKYMLLRENCRKILTHVKSTETCIKKIFNSSIIDEKVKYIPIGVEDVCESDLCRTYQKKLGEKIRMFFSSSWHQEGFFVRGGIDLLVAFDKICDKYDNVELTLKCTLPVKLPQVCNDIIARRREKIHLIEGKLLDEEMTELMKNMDVFLLPAARMHIVSILRTMAQGIPIIASDGWGIEEYITDGFNGSIAKGRYGKTSWIDEEGMLQEDYSVLKNVDNEFVEKIELVLNDDNYRNMITKNAMKDHSYYSIKRYNEDLKLLYYFGG